MENTKKLFMEINNIIFDNKEKMNDNDYIEIQNKSKKIFDELNNMSDLIDKLNEFSELFDEFNKSDDEEEDFEEEEIELYSETYWELERGNCCLLTNTRTKVEYYAHINEIFPNLKKVEFILDKEFHTDKKVNRKVKINFDNKKSLYSYCPC
jgi:ribosomal protein L16 Arg81 hydroxylase